MRRLLLLERTMRKCSGNMFANIGMESTTVDEDLSKNQKLLQYLGIAIVASLVMFLIGKVSFGIFTEFVSDGLDKLAYEGICVGLTLICLFLSVQKALSLFFLSSNNESLIHMPIRPSMIAIAKALIIYRSCLIAMLLIGVPVLVAAQISSDGISFSLIAATLTPLFIPITPIFYVTALSLLMMRFIHIGKSKESRTSTITVIFMLFMMIVPMGLNFLQSGVNAKGGIEAAIQGISSIITIFEYIFPTLILAVMGLQRESMFYLLLFFAATLVIVLIYIWISETFYLRAILQNASCSSKQKSSDVQTILRYGKSLNSAKKAYARKERQLLFRTPVFFLQAVLTSIILIVLFTGLCIFFLLQIIPELTQLKQENLGGFEAYIWYVALALILIVSALSVAFTHVTSTCISREGSGFAYMKTIPIPMRIQLSVKSRIGLYLAMAGAFPFIVIIDCVCCFLSANVLIVPVSLILSGSLLIFGNDLQLYLDCKDPLLNWEIEYAAVTNNHLLLSSIGPLLFAAALLGIGTLLCTFFKTFMIPVIGIVLVITIVFTYFAHNWFYSHAVKYVLDK